MGPNYSQCAVHPVRSDTSRDTSANTDLRLAPILNWKRINLKERDYLLTFFTPFVATAKVFSDRDFKLNEAKGVVEFRPVLGRLFRDIRNPKYLEKMKNPPKMGLDYKFGRTLVPVAGFEVGNSYTRGRPAGDLQPIGAFYRAYLGADAALNVKRRLILSTTQTFYYRAELDTNRWVHYSKNTLEWSFTTSSTLLGAAAYLTFEKGRLPPFNSAVNAVKLGVRLQSQGWTDYLR